MWELEDEDDEGFIVTLSEVRSYVFIILILLCCNFPFLAVYYAMIGYHIVFQEDDTDALMQREQDSVTVDVGLYSLMERFDYEVSDVKMMNLVKEVSIDPILPSSYALLDSYLNSLLVNLKNHEALGLLPIKDIRRPVNVEVSLNQTQKNFLKFQIKFTDKFYEIAASGTWFENLKFIKYKSHQTIINEYLQTSFFRHGLYSQTEFDIEANLLDYNIWAINYKNYTMLSDTNEFLIYDKIDGGLKLNDTAKSMNEK